MQLLPATVYDAPAISRLIQRNPAQRPNGPTAQRPVGPSGAGADRFLEFVTPQAVRGYIESPSVRCVVAMTDGGLIGVVALCNTTHLHHLFVHPERQRQGLGCQSWAHAQQALVAADASAR